MPRVFNSISLTKCYRGLDSAPTGAQLAPPRGVLEVRVIISKDDMKRPIKLKKSDHKFFVVQAYQSDKFISPKLSPTTDG